MTFIASALTQVLFLLIWPTALHRNFKPRAACAVNAASAGAQPDSDGYFSKVNS